MKKFQNLGKVLSKENQLSILGGFIALSGTRYSDGHCYCDYISIGGTQGTALICNMVCDISNCRSQGTAPE